MQEYRERLFKETPGSYFLFGPRGTGKTLWLRHHHAEACRIDLLDSETYRTYLAHPEKIRAVLAGMPPGQTTVVIDEVQKVPSLLDEVHQAISQQTGKRFILTGSSSRKLKRQGGDLLAGRAAVLTLHPFIGAELGAQFDLLSALRWGMLPVVLGEKDRDAALDAYLAAYLHEEIQQEGLVRNTGNFSRFLEAMSFSHGSLLNATEVARECQVRRSTVEGYLSILEDLLLGFRLPVFKRRATRQMTDHPKFYFFDCGVYRKLRPRGPLDRADEVAGATLEGLVAQHLRTWIAYSQNESSLYYWRTKSGSEVDFVVYGPNCFTAIEVKSSSRVKRQDVRSLRAFQADYPEARAILLYGGTQPLKVHDIPCLPCEDFLRNLTPGNELGK